MTQEANSPFSPIETSYQGYRFRSRLEARWAVALDHLSVQWLYEVEGYNLGPVMGFYLPDFLVRNWDRNEFWIEIKGSQPTKDELLKAAMLAAKSQRVAFVVQDDPYSALVWRSQSVLSPNLHMSRATVHDLRTLLQCPQKAWDEACTAARSARFEHGESGAPGWKVAHG